MMMELEGCEIDSRIGELMMLATFTIIIATGRTPKVVAASTRRPL
jgi:hypothetical protein